MSDRAAGDNEREVHERRRAEIVAAEVPASYDHRVHMFAPSVFGAVVCVTAALLVRDLHPIELLVLPITLLLGFGFEWRVHKDVLHKNRPGLGIIYRRHELQHHVIYRHDDMAMRSPREMFLILMPTWGIVIVFGLVVPLAAGVYFALSMNAALLFVVASMTFYLFYEWSHLSYHLPPDSFVGRMRLVRVMRELHRTHHDPALMKKWNFNVTVPLFDWIHGTMFSPGRARLREEKRAAKVARAK